MMFSVPLHSTLDMATALMDGAVNHTGASNAPLLRYYRVICLLVQSHFIYGVDVSLLNSVNRLLSDLCAFNFHRLCFSELSIALHMSCHVDVSYI
jgi:hypothetical protein